ncbi:metallophosphoesterase family protein [Leptolinea tardivitalis]|uniref:Phosphoesterase n=1 Tax=Leptolinea tardivitalis TaxID=229920 RepID=A0A0P6XMQ4_9CHLR|nr:metallophosphoesterase family protein [Leptolinea tardivitalis]KPL70211.1 phosphoesterase [Leptolinea tardivitalis]GAP21746.1 predicted phosphoesterase [Leptolinea tardivitalis]
MIAIISDIHGNLPALQAVLKKIASLGCENVLSLGDVVGYYAQPGECIDLLRLNKIPNIMGNHDSYIVNGTNCSRSKIVSEIIDYQRKIITPDQVKWLSESTSCIIENGDYFTHGSWKDMIDGYLYNVSPSDFPQGAIHFFAGHTHVQSLIKIKGQTFCNPGSVGQPRDGDPRAAFATLSDNEVILHRVEYDIDLAAYQMKKAGFPEYCYKNLYLGAQIGGRIDRITINS